MYRDIVRVPEKHRIDVFGRVVPDGSVCSLLIREGTYYVLVRGLGDSAEEVICMDERLRNVLGLSVGERIDVQFRSTGWWGQFRWAWSASDPAYRVAARLSLLSVLLGALGLVLGLISLRGCS